MISLLPDDDARNEDRSTSHRKIRGDGKVKALTRVRNTSTGEVRYRWSKAGSTDNYWHTHAYDHLAGQQYVPMRVVLYGIGFIGILPES